MSTLRRDPITGRWVINVSKKSEGASTLTLLEEYASKNICPLCEGNEQCTPPEIFALRETHSQKDKPGWEVRVIPNLSPSLKIEDELDRRGELMYDLMNAVGANEIIIETPQHVENLADLDVSQIQKVWEVCKERISDLKKDKRFKQIVVFKSYGKRAIPSPLKHAYSQLIALSITPKALKEELVGAKNYYEYKTRCVYCDIIRQELDTDKRVVASNKHFVALTPFASRYTHEVWILPKKHSPDFETSSADELYSLSSLLKDILLRLGKLLNDPPYNYMLHTGPNRVTRKGYWKSLDSDYHWHIEIMPSFTRVSGFEWGTGFFINLVTPEEAAQNLKKIKVESEVKI